MAVTQLVLLMMLTVVSYTDADDNIYDQLNKTSMVDDVFFMATFNNTYQTVASGTIRFDKVRINLGNAYDADTGVFTAPKNGGYGFVVQSLTNGDGLANWDLYINGEMVQREQPAITVSNRNMYVYPKILKLGDTVYVNSSNPVDIRGLNHSFFIGWLLKNLPS